MFACAWVGLTLVAVLIVLSAKRTIMSLRALAAGQPLPVDVSHCGVQVPPFEQTFTFLLS